MSDWRQMRDAPENGKWFVDADLTDEELFFNVLKKDLCANGWGYAIVLLEHIQKKASRDPDYAARLDEWRKRGHTLVLRDDLCEPFRHFRFITAVDPLLPCPYHNMWSALDSSGLRARDAVRERRKKRRAT